MGANLKTWSGVNIAPLYDALMHMLFTVDGVIYGCDISGDSVDTNVINITHGFGMIQGRFFEIEETSVSVPLSSGDTLNGQLILQMDLSNADEPLKVVYDTGTELRPLTQDTDVNIVNGVYEIQLCTFRVDASSVSEVTATYESCMRSSVANIYDRVANPLKVVTVEKDNISINANGNATVMLSPSIPEGYKIVGCFPFSTSNASNNGRASSVCYIFTHTIYNSNNTIEAHVRNNDGQTARIKVTARVLCAKR